MNRLKQKYQTTIVPELAKELNLDNLLAVPSLNKVVVSTAFKEDQHQDQAIDLAKKWLAVMTGQMPKTTVAKKSVASFNIREGDILGLQVTLRRDRMWGFVDKLISIALPRLRDFQGISLNGFDGHGNYTLGLTEQIIFPEVDYDTIGKVRGLQITFVTTADNDKIARRLLESIGMPFEKEEIRG
ncbi:50S ribosomal protein L5 [Candidatus Collierbacteria bacterium]|nr:50S ribosomal protein L5 [Candidatus Collierbacteria bacterium]